MAFSNVQLIPEYVFVIPEYSYWAGVIIVLLNNQADEDHAATLTYVTPLSILPYKGKLSINLWFMFDAVV